MEPEQLPLGVGHGNTVAMGLARSLTWTQMHNFMFPLSSWIHSFLQSLVFLKVPPCLSCCEGKNGEHGAQWWDQQGKGFHQMFMGWNPALPLTSCVTLNELLNFSEM